MPRAVTKRCAKFSQSTFGISRQMRIVIAHGAVDLAEDLRRGQALFGALQTVHHVRHFLAQSARRGGLPVGAAQHRQVGVLVGKVFQTPDQHLQRGQHHGIARALEHQRVAQVVDVFRGAGEMDEFQYPGCFRIAG